MNIIIQLFNLSNDDKKVFFNNLERYTKNPKVKNIILFSDFRIPKFGSKVKLFNRKTRITYYDIFKMVGDSILSTDVSAIVKPMIYYSPSDDDYEFSDKIIVLKNGVVLFKNYNDYPPYKKFIYSEIEYLKYNIAPKVSKKIAVVVHLYYQDLLQEYISRLKVLMDSNYEVDYYFTLVDGSATVGQTEWVRDKILKVVPNSYVDIRPNRGLDIGSFLMTIKKIQESGNKYDYLLKIHTKKSLESSGEYFGKQWRNNLLDSVISKDGFKKSMDSLSYSDVGMVGCNKWFIHNNNLNVRLIKEMRNELGIRKGNKFIGGTMFWVKPELLYKYLTIDVIQKIYPRLEIGYFKQIDPKKDSEYITHAMERLFGYMVEDSGLKIVGI